MFTKISRYRNLENVVVTDPDGREFSSKSVRLLPATSAVMEHVVDESDRLDHLAYKYYRQPRHWWKICDANPEYKSPLSLLGKDPVLTAWFPVSYTGVAAPWHILKPLLQSKIGISEVLFGNGDQPRPDAKLFDGGLLTSIDISMVSEMDSSILLQNLTPELSDAIADAGFTVSDDIHLEKISDTRWEMKDRKNSVIYVFRAEGSNLVMYAGNINHEWGLTISFNVQNISDSDIVDVIDGSPFTCETSFPIGRVGKTIGIPMKIQR